MRDARPTPAQATQGEPRQVAATPMQTAELLESALDTLDEGLVVLDSESRVVSWNSAAAAITGFQRSEAIARRYPSGLYEAQPQHQPHSPASIDAHERPIAVLLHHRQGHTLPAMLRCTPLRDALGARCGLVLRFHPLEEVDALPHGDSAEGVGIERSQADLEDRLDEAAREWKTNLVPFGLLWITVDQSATLRKTHGREACEAMLAIVERTLLHGLRPTEILGRWGNDEFLVLSHERTAAMLDRHAQHLAEITRTADFRWWGDRVALTVSIGAAQATEGVSLASLLRQAQQAMQASIAAGGNRVHSGIHSIQLPGGRACSQS